jgi:cation:H+ antiporter
VLGIILFVVGLGLLVGGGEALVRGATSLARAWGLPPAVIGLTVVAMGTSLPELAVGLLAALRGQPDLAVGNVIGSNIFNVTAALGITALICTLPVRGSAVRLEWPVMFAASGAALLVLRDSFVDRVEAGVLLSALVLFTAYSVRIARREITGEEKLEFEAEVSGRLATARGNTLLAAGLVLLGIVLLVVGGHSLVTGAVSMARQLGLSERVIGLTVVAIGTGTPELAASIVAAMRKQTDVAVANMIGSNIFNVLGILSITALVHPIRVSAAMAGPDLWWMLGTSLLLFPVLWRGMKVERWEGGLLVLVYAVYLALLV